MKNKRLPLSRPLWYHKQIDFKKSTTQGDIMKIKIIGVDDPLILKEFAVINQGFFEKSFFVDHDPDITVDFRQTSACTKQDYLKIYFQFLTEKFGKLQPWGLLNGMRPTKLVHSKKKRGMSNEEIAKNFQDQYLLSDEKMTLLLAVADLQHQVVPDLYTLDGEVSLYIGIPFCPTRCAYCTFAAYAFSPHEKWVAPFLDALLAEIDLIGDYLLANNIPVTSIYLGGGTATTLEVDQLRQILAALSEKITDINQVREITVEAGRPDTITREKLELLKAFNVNRISINPQSFHQITLDTIGRHHLVDDVFSTFELAKKIGIPNINMDLIVGLPGEETKELLHSLAQIKKLQPESITVHMLAFKRNSEMSNDRGLFTVASREVLTDMAKLTYDFAKEEGYLPYYLYRQKNISGNLENIGYAKANQACVYNIVMMEEAQNVLGLGVGASSKFLFGESVHNPKDLRTYIENYAQYAQRKIEMLELSASIGAKSFTYHPPVVRL